MLAPPVHGRSLAEIWVPELARRSKEDPEKWKWLAAHLLGRVTVQDEKGLAPLRELAAEGPKELRIEALGALVRSARSRLEMKGRLDDKTRELLADAFKSDDPSRVTYALGMLLDYGGSMGMGGGMGGMGGGPVPTLSFVPELVPLLFHEDENVQRQARGVLRYVSKEDAPQVVKTLIVVLEDDDESRSRDHISAMRALAAIGGSKAREAMPALVDVIKESDNNDELIAAALAAWNIFYRGEATSTIRELPEPEVLLRVWKASKVEGVNPSLLVERIELAAGGEGFKQLADEEAKAIFPTPAPGTGGGMF